MTILLIIPIVWKQTFLVGKEKLRYQMFGKRRCEGKRQRTENDWNVFKNEEYLATKKKTHEMRSRLCVSGENCWTKKNLRTVNYDVKKSRIGSDLKTLEGNKRVDDFIGLEEKKRNSLNFEFSEIWIMKLSRIVIVLTSLFTVKEACEFNKKNCLSVCMYVY